MQACTSMHSCHTHAQISPCTQAVESAVRKVGGQGHPSGPDDLLHKAETKDLSWDPKERLLWREWAGLWVLRSSHVTIGKYGVTFLVGLFRGVAHVVLGAGSSMVHMGLESQGQAVVGGGKTAAVVAICLFCPGLLPSLRVCNPPLQRRLLPCPQSLFTCR